MRHTLSKKSSIKVVTYPKKIPNKKTRREYEETTWPPTNSSVKISLGSSRISLLDNISAITLNDLEICWM